MRGSQSLQTLYRVARNNNHLDSYNYIYTYISSIFSGLIIWAVELSHRQL